MKILFIIPDFSIGGVTTVVNNLVKELGKNNVETKVVTLFDGDGSNENISLRVNGLYSAIKAIFKLKKVIKEFKPDVIHTHTMYSHYYGFICAIIKKDFKLVCTEHGTYNKKLKIYTRMYLFKLLNFYSDIVTNVSNVSSQSYIDQKIVSKNKIKTLYNGIDVKKYQYNSNARKKIRSELNICDDTILLGYIGRLSEEKNIINLLNSLKYIGNNYRLIIVGDGPLKEDILKYIIDFNLSEKILYLGKKENIPDYYSAIDLLVLPSDTEGLPTVVLEAMAAECLVVTTNCGGVKEIFPIDYNYIVDVKDHLKLSQAINEILNTSNEEKNKIRKICFDRVKNEFSIEKANSNWLRLYNDI